MKRVFYVSIVFLGVSLSAPAQPIPSILWGKWIVKRALPTRTISCWGEKETKALIGTELEYSSEVFRWGKRVTMNPVTETTTITARQFHDENSGAGANSSQVTFEQLGIKERQVLQVVISHHSADITQGTVEIPGDRLLVKDQKTIIFSACNVYFEAKRTAAASAPLRR